MEQQSIFNECSPGSCTTPNSDQYSIIFHSDINLHSLHGGAWGNYPTTGEERPCEIAQDAEDIFNKPVIINDDGGATTNDRNNNCTVKDWANEATGSTCAPLGIIHFEHLEEGKQQPTNANCGTNCTPPVGETADIDCGSYSRLGDIAPFSDFRLVASSSCPGLTATQYCIARGCYNP